MSLVRALHGRAAMAGAGAPWPVMGELAGEGREGEWEVERWVRLGGGSPCCCAWSLLGLVLCYVRKKAGRRKEKRRERKEKKKERKKRKEKKKKNPNLEIFGKNER
jgi:hypothetical protein